ncbi:hypothetical protein O181_051347 [Austropuccinia psidii MF-1]|uniref:Uncharacterized protein n=1 Tax=Austropuccinia psidii MF-1 TaxID=1389203 RepID=A0A9Q3HPH8_9BASI|nr:hypothetical protein [Austropuccinia psidii MF-1]
MAQKCHLGPRPPNEKGWFWQEGPEPPRTQKDTPRARNKDKDVGVGDMEELAREAKDGRIWPEAIYDDWSHKGPGNSDMAKNAIEHQKGPNFP